MLCARLRTQISRQHTCKRLPHSHPVPWLPSICLAKAHPWCLIAVCLPQQPALPILDAVHVLLLSITLMYCDHVAANCGGPTPVLFLMCGRTHAVGPAGTGRQCTAGHQACELSQTLLQVCLGTCLWDFQLCSWIAPCSLATSALAWQKSQSAGTLIFV